MKDLYRYSENLSTTVKAAEVAISAYERIPKNLLNSTAVEIAANQFFVVQKYNFHNQLNLVKQNFSRSAMTNLDIAKFPIRAASIFGNIPKHWDITTSALQKYAVQSSYINNINWAKYSDVISTMSKIDPYIHSLKKKFGEQRVPAVAVDIAALHSDTIAKFSQSFNDLPVTTKMRSIVSDDEKMDELLDELKFLRNKISNMEEKHELASDSISRDEIQEMIDQSSRQAQSRKILSTNTIKKVMHFIGGCLVVAAQHYIGTEIVPKVMSEIHLEFMTNLKEEVENHHEDSLILENKPELLDAGIRT